MGIKTVALGAALAALAATASAQSNITVLPNGRPTVYSIANVTQAESQWGSLGSNQWIQRPGNLSIVDGGAQLTNNTFGQNGAVFYNSTLPRDALFGGYDQDIGFLIDRQNGPQGGNGIGWVFQPGALPNATTQPLLYPPAGAARVPGALEVHVGTNGQASANEPQTGEFIAVYKDRNINYNDVPDRCKLQLPDGTLTNRPAGIKTAFDAANNGTLRIWYRNDARPYPVAADITCTNAPMPNVTGVPTTSFSIMGATGDAAGNRHLINTFNTSFCSWPNSGYSGANGTFCFCAAPLVPNAAGDACVGAPPPPEPSSGLSGGAIAGIVIGSVAGAALLGGGAYALAKRNRSEPAAEETPMAVKEVPVQAAAAAPVAAAAAPAVTATSAVPAVIGGAAAVGGAAYAATKAAPVVSPATVLVPGTNSTVVTPYGTVADATRTAPLGAVVPANHTAAVPARVVEGVDNRFTVAVGGAVIVPDGTTVTVPAGFGMTSTPAGTTTANVTNIPPTATGAARNVSVPAGSLNVPTGSTITIPGGSSLTVPNGTVVLPNGGQAYGGWTTYDADKFIAKQ